MQLFVKTLDGKTISVRGVELCDDIAKITQQVEEIEGIQQDHQRLIYAGRDLQSGNTLKDYGIQDQSTIHLVVRLPGGSHA